MTMLKLLIVSVVWSGGMVWADSATELVTEAYENILGHQPDDQELNDYRSKVIDEKWTAEDVQTALKKSDAYYNKVIHASFQDVLGRDADEDALNTYRERMRKGETEEQLRKSLRNSVEYRDMYRKEFKTSSS